MIGIPHQTNPVRHNRRKTKQKPATDNGAQSLAKGPLPAVGCAALGEIIEID
jgi:hypothetical protein